jgi:hypothetical protein
MSSVYKIAVMISLPGFPNDASAMSSYLDLHTLLSPTSSHYDTCICTSSGHSDKDRTARMIQRQRPQVMTDASRCQS